MMIIRKMHTLSTHKKRSLLLILGLVGGVWLALDQTLTISQRKLIFESMMLSTFVWMLIWTIRKHEKKVKGE